MREGERGMRNERLQPMVKAAKREWGARRFAGERTACPPRAGALACSLRRLAEESSFTTRASFGQLSRPLSARALPGKTRRGGKGDGDGSGKPEHGMGNVRFFERCDFLRREREREGSDRVVEMMFF